MGEYLVIRYGTSGPHLYRKTGGGLSCHSVKGFFNRAGHEVYTMEEVFNLARDGKFKGNPALCGDGDVSLSDDQGNHLFFTIEPFRLGKCELSSYAVASVSVKELPAMADEGLQEIFTDGISRYVEIGEEIMWGGYDMPALKKGQKVRFVMSERGYYGNKIEQGWAYDLEVISFMTRGTGVVYKLQVLKVMVDES